MRRGMTTGWGTKVARVFSAASGAVLVAVLAGCSLGESHSDDPSEIPSSSSAAAVPSADAPPAFHFQSGDLVLGDFTYEEVAGNIFNPCEEISAEEFAAIGFERDSEVGERRTEEKISCRLVPNENAGPERLAVFSGPANFEDVAAQSEIYGVEVSDLVPGLYLHGPRTTNSDFCFASVDTKRGQFSIISGDVESSEPVEERCSRAERIMEKLYRI